VNKFAWRTLVTLFCLSVWMTISSWPAHCAPSSEEEHRLIPPEVLTQINADYVKSVRAIFEQKCFDCHSQSAHLPWYSAIPGVGYMINHDIQEARADMDMSKDFPFVGKGKPDEYLSVIQDVLTDGSMPPWRYRIMHADSKLTEDDKKTVKAWLDRSNALIGL
jgi:Haem-binding domain